MTTTISVGPESIIYKIHKREQAGKRLENVSGQLDKVIAYLQACIDDGSLSRDSTHRWIQSLQQIRGDVSNSGEEYKRRMTEIQNLLDRVFNSPNGEM